MRLALFACMLFTADSAHADRGVFVVTERLDRVALSDGTRITPFNFVCRGSQPKLFVRFDAMHATAAFLDTIPPEAEPFATFTASLVRTGSDERQPYEIRVLMTGDESSLALVANDTFTLTYGVDGRFSGFVAELEDVRVRTAAGRMPSLSGANWGLSSGWATSFAEVNMAALLSRVPRFERIEVSVFNPDRGDVLRRTFSVSLSASDQAASADAVDAFLEACVDDQPSGGASAILQ